MGARAWILARFRLVNLFTAAVGQGNLVRVMMVGVIFLGVSSLLSVAIAVLLELRMH